MLHWILQRTWWHCSSFYYRQNKDLSCSRISAKILEGTLPYKAIVKCSNTKLAIIIIDHRRSLQDPTRGKDVWFDCKGSNFKDCRVRIAIYCVYWLSWKKGRWRVNLLTEKLLLRKATIMGTTVKHSIHNSAFPLCIVFLLFIYKL